MFDENPLERIEQIDAMRMGVDYRLQIEVRGFKMMVRPLSISESLQVAADVTEEYKKLPDNAKNSLTENAILAKKTIVLASTSGPGQNDPKITDLVLSQMTNDEIHYIFKQYISACDRVNPALEVMEREEVKTLVEDIKKNSKPEDLVSQLIELSFSQLMSMAHFYLTKGD